MNQSAACHTDCEESEDLVKVRSPMRWKDWCGCWLEPVGSSSCSKKRNIQRGASYVTQMNPIFVTSRGPGFVAEGQGQLQSWRDNLQKWSKMTNYIDTFMVKFFLIPMDPHGLKFNPRTFRVMIRFPLPVIGLLHQRRRARELRGVVRGRVRAEGRVYKSDVFRKCSRFQTWTTKRKPTTWFSSGSSSIWNDQGLWVSQS